VLGTGRKMGLLLNVWSFRTKLFPFNILKHTQLKTICHIMSSLSSVVNNVYVTAVKCSCLLFRVGLRYSRFIRDRWALRRTFVLSCWHECVQTALVCVFLLCGIFDDPESRSIREGWIGACHVGGLDLLQGSSPYGELRDRPRNLIRSKLRSVRSTS